MNRKKIEKILNDKTKKIKFIFYSSLYILI